MFYPLLENINNCLPSVSANTSLPSGNMSEPCMQKHDGYWLSMLWNRFQHESSSYSSNAVIHQGHIVYLDPKGKLIDRVNISGMNSTSISLRDDTINCTDSVPNTIYCYTLTGQQIW
jgi:hypothetical protein